VDIPRIDIFFLPNVCQAKIGRIFKWFSARMIPTRNPVPLNELLKIKSGMTSQKSDIKLISVTFARISSNNMEFSCKMNEFLQ